MVLHNIYIIHVHVCCTQLNLQKCDLECQIGSNGCRNLTSVFLKNECHMESACVYYNYILSNINCCMSFLI